MNLLRVCITSCQNLEGGGFYGSRFTKLVKMVLNFLRIKVCVWQSCVYFSSGCEVE